MKEDERAETDARLDRERMRYNEVLKGFSEATSDVKEINRRVDTLESRVQQMFSSQKRCRARTLRKEDASAGPGEEDTEEGRAGDVKGMGVERGRQQ